MAGLTFQGHRKACQGHREASRLGGMAALAATLVLAGCSGTTYGTGTSPGLQTVEDLAGIASLSSAKKDPIDYQPRPKVVLPPEMAALPAPTTADSTTTVSADWPNDPDALRAKIRADAAAREASGAPTPEFKLPPGSTPTPALANSRDSDAPLTPEEQAKVKKLFADARGGLAVDANGNPIRRYLTDPPPDYRVPDPTAPVAFDPATTKKKKFKWWWQTGDGN